ncbi:MULTISPECIES: hypothetical protein [Clostridium]|uniref:hypothetical protein n=1 Tax=Clostridium TaxID=1485 RepID=UPI000AE10BA4|nr:MULTISPECIES: hypothetical protein [Clostridium]
MVILFMIFVLSKQSVSTFNITSKNTVIKDYDVNGDGNNDIIYIKTNNDKYFIQVNCKDRSYILKPNKVIKTMGSYKNYWPITLTLADVTRDKVNEMFVQSSQNDTPIQHMFIWDNNNFKDVLYNYNNIIGLIDSHNNETPKIISANFFNNKIDFSNFILIRNKLKNYTANYKDNAIGKDSVAALICKIQTLDPNELKNQDKIFYSDSWSTFAQIYNKLIKDNNTYTFEDGSFKDTRYNKDGEISEVKWILNFKSISKSNVNELKNYSLDVTLRASEENKDNPYYFKISNLDLSYN